MIFRITGINQTNSYNSYPQQQELKTKCYNTPITKEEVKEDFGIVLEKEMKKLHFEEVV